MTPTNNALEQLFGVGSAEFATVVFLEELGSSIGNRATDAVAFTDTDLFVSLNRRLQLQQGH